MALPPWFDRTGNDRNRRSREQEKKHAKSVGGKVQPGSGSSWRAPQDVRGPDFLDQLKYTDGSGFRISVDEWRKIERDAFQSGREPRLVIEFESFGITLYVTRESAHGDHPSGAS